MCSNCTLKVLEYNVMVEEEEKIRIFGKELNSTERKCITSTTTKLDNQIISIDISSESVCINLLGQLLKGFYFHTYIYIICERENNKILQ